MLVVLATTPESLAARQTVSEENSPLARIDSLRDAGAFERAFAAARNAHDRGNRDPELLWRLAYLRIEITEAYRSPDTSEPAFRQALSDAEVAVEKGPYLSNAHAARAMAAGKLIRVTSSTQEKIELSRVMKESVDHAITYDPHNDVAYYIRGRWHLELSELSFLERTVARALYGGLPAASLEGAIVDLKHAVELEDRIVYRLELARAYDRADRDDLAAEQVDHLLRMPAEHPDDVRYKREAAKLLDEIRPSAGG